MDTTADRFTRDVIEASRERPVLVDFWAPWCGPCRALGPLLEKLERDYKGRFALVKVNSDENPQLSARFHVRSIPYVIAFVDGKPVDAFVGALPESQLRAFIDRLIPNPSELERRKAAQLVDAGQFAAAATALRAAIALDPDNDAARADLVTLLLDRMPEQPDEARLQEAEQVLAAVSRRHQNEPVFSALRTRLAALKESARLPGLAELQARVATAPDDLTARLQLAQRLIAQRQFEPALEQLLAIVERDRRFGDEIGRKTMLAVFEMLADQPELVARYRRRLSAALHR
ncbi:MAG: thioredoxin [Sutterellaceae bacterium]|nr:thioredoxin [Burkholderiaceae bacterium]MDW8430039.1 thioredoxin [Sutterellaceae bacterium]